MGDGALTGALRFGVEDDPAPRLSEVRYPVSPDKNAISSSIGLTGRVKSVAVDPSGPATGCWAQAGEGIRESHDGGQAETELSCAVVSSQPYSSSPRRDISVFQLIR